MVAYVANVFWLTRPPYMRWFATAVVIATSAAFDLAGRTTEPVPFAKTDIPRGVSLAAVNIEWRDSPTGLLDAAIDLDGFTNVPIAAGNPITASAVVADRPIPSNWWSVSVDLTTSATQGQPVRLVGLDPEFVVDGVVTATAHNGAFGVDDPGLVAVPADVAEQVARAAATGRIVVLLGS